MNEINELREEIAKLRERVAVLEAEKRAERTYNTGNASRARLTQLMNTPDYTPRDGFFLKGDIPPGTTRS